MYSSTLTLLIYDTPTPQMSDSTPTHLPHQNHLIDHYGYNPTILLNPHRYYSSKIPIQSHSRNASSLALPTGVYIYIYIAPLPLSLYKNPKLIPPPIHLHVEGTTTTLHKYPAQLPVSLSMLPDGGSCDA